jgi:hypothetical protein
MNCIFSYVLETFGYFSGIPSVPAILEDYRYSFISLMVLTSYMISWVNLFSPLALSSELFTLKELTDLEWMEL